jgi:hypothetical protein
MGINVYAVDMNKVEVLWIKCVNDGVGGDTGWHV